MNQPSILRRSRGHRARAAVNKATVEKRYVNRVLLRASGRTREYRSPKGVKVIDQRMTEFNQFFEVLVEAPTHMDWVQQPGDYFHVVSIERRRAQ